MLRWSSVADLDRVPAGHIRAEGKIKNVNTIEDFKIMDKGAMLQTAGKQVSHPVLFRCSEIRKLTTTDLGCYQ